MNGEAVKDARDLSRRISSLLPGASVNLTVVREGKERTIDVKLAKLPDQKMASNRQGGDNSEQDEADLPRLGLKLAPADSVSGAGKEGVVVTDIDSSGAAAERGIKSGDVILEVGGKHVTRPSDIRNAIVAARKDGKSVVLLRIKSGDGNRFVTLPTSKG